MKKELSPALRIELTLEEIGGKQPTASSEVEIRGMRCRILEVKPPKIRTNAVDELASPTAPATNPRSRIDYIFYRPNSGFELVESKVVPELMASDHRPVFAILKIAPK